MQKIVVVFIVMITFFNSFGQSSGRKLYPGMTKTRGDATIPLSKTIAYRWTYFGSIGRTSYFGELCDGLDCVFKGFNQPNLTFQLGLRYRFDMRWSLGASMRYAMIGGSDQAFTTRSQPNKEGKPSGRWERNLSFQTHVYEFMINGRFDLIPVITRFIGEKADQYNRRNFIVPYLFAGVGFIYFSPTAQVDGKYYTLADKVTNNKKEQGQKYSQLAFVMNGGVGAQIKLVEFLDLSLDLGVTRTTTNYLDDVGPNDKYPSWNASTNPAVAPSEIDYKLADRHQEADPTLSRVDPNNPGANPYRGGTKTSFFTLDYYFIAQVSIHYTLSHPSKLSNPRHRHFKSGKGIKHHHFNTR
ncbi:MAG: hypothetical protein SFY32_02260 [Bacteroidota bacterium]|nr:hypothetical protein [Bacteroidota bacterium]